MFLKDFLREVYLEWRKVVNNNKWLQTTSTQRALATFSLRRIWAIFGEPTQFSPAFKGDKAWQGARKMQWTNKNNHLMTLSFCVHFFYRFRDNMIWVCSTFRRIMGWEQLQEKLKTHISFEVCKCFHTSSSNMSSWNGNFPGDVRTHKNKSKRRFQCVNLKWQHVRPVSSLYRITPHAKMSERGEYLPQGKSGLCISFTLFTMALFM